MCKLIFYSFLYVQTNIQSKYFVQTFLLYDKNLLSFLSK